MLQCEQAIFFAPKNFACIQFDPRSRHDNGDMTGDGVNRNRDTVDRLQNELPFRSDIEEHQAIRWLIGQDFGQEGSLAALSEF